MSETITIELPAIMKTNGSDRTIEIDTSVWPDPQAFALYIMYTGLGVIMQRSSAGKKDDPAKALKAVDSAIERLMKGTVPSGGGFTKLSPEDYAMKEALVAAKEKFAKGESVADVMQRLAVKFTELLEAEEGASEDDIAELDLTNEEAIEATLAKLQGKLEKGEVYKTALKSRKAKGKSGDDIESFMESDD